MQLLPYYDKMKAEGYLTDTEMSVLVAVMYLAAICYICLLMMALSNTWKFLVK